MRWYAILATVFLIGGCVQPELDPVLQGGNRLPVISSLVADPPEITVGESSNITVVASDPDNDPLTYRWSSSTGDVIGEGPSVRFSAAFCCAGPNYVQVAVRDNGGGSATEKVHVLIYPR
jgi:hypothetical protein